MSIARASIPEQLLGLPRATVLLWWAQWALPGALLLHRLLQFLRHPGRAPLLRLDVLLALAWIAASVLVLRTRPGSAWVRRFGRQVGLLCIASCAALLLAELGARVALYGSLAPNFAGPEQALRQPHPTRGWTLVPGARAVWDTLDYSVTVRTNSRGLHDVEHSPRPAPGVFRIVVLGDSFMEAYQVALDESLPRRLQRQLSGRKVEAINLGVGGYGTAQQYVTLLEEGLSYEPDLVLLAFFAFNDVRNNHPWLEGRLRAQGSETMRTFGRPYGRIDPASGELRIEYPDYQRIASWVAERRREKVRYIEDISLLARCGQNALARLMAPGARSVPTHDPNIWLGSYILDFDDQGPVAGAEYARHWEEAWDVSLRLIGAVRDQAEKHGARFAAFIVPNVIEVDDDELAAITKRFPYIQLERSAPSARILDYCSRHGIDVLDLTPVFKNQHVMGRGPFYHRREDNHWNSAGHALAAGALIEFLDEHGLLPEPPRG